MNLIRRSTFPIIEEIRIQSLGTFLVRRGWKATPSTEGSDKVYEWPSEGRKRPIRIYLPSDGDVFARTSRVEDAVSILCAVENRTREEILYLILRQGVDSHEKRIQGEGTSRDIPLNMAADVLIHLKQMASQAALHEAFPAPHSDAHGAAANAFLDSCRFPHTFLGSFGLAMEVRIPSEAQVSIHAPDQHYPFERRVMKRLAVGLRTCEKVLATKDAGLLVDTYQAGLNGNMCLSLAAFTKRLKTHEVISSFSWDQSWKDEALETLQDLWLTPDLAPFLDEAGKALKAMRRSVPDHFIATIKAIKDALPTGRFNEAAFLNPDRTVILWQEHIPGQSRSVMVSLDQADYAQACDAFRDGFQVEIKGDLERKGNTLYFSRYEIFRVTKMRKVDVVDEIRKRSTEITRTQAKLLLEDP